MSSKPRKSKGTAKQKRFAKIYAQGDITATDAAIKAGYSSSSREVSQVIGSKTLAHPIVQNLINQELDRALGNPEGLVGSVAREILTNPDAKNSDKIQIIKWLTDVRDWSTPKKTAILKADITKKFQLPRDE